MPGRFGQGYRMERGRTNHLSLNQASVEQASDGLHRRRRGPAHQRPSAVPLWGKVACACGPAAQRWRRPLRDRGLPQEVTVTVPAGFAPYDVLAHRRLETRLEQGRQTFQLTLGPGAAAVVAALPAAIASLEFPVPATIKPGSETNLPLTLLDEANHPPAGRQLAEVTITAPSGPWFGMQRYQRIQDGRRIIPLRLPLTAAPGKWQIRVKEWLSGLEVVKEFEVRFPRKRSSLFKKPGFWDPRLV